MGTNLSTILYLKIPSTPENISLVEPFIAQLKRKIVLNDTKYADILLVLTEAVNNAIIHGNCANPSKYVHLHLHILPNKLNFKVVDEGCGFNPATLPDPTHPPRCYQPNGRGVYLMKQLADEIAFEKEGSAVLIIFNT